MNDILSRSIYYYLIKKDKVVIGPVSILEYSELCEKHGRDQTVKKTNLKINGVDIEISTICLMVDHSFDGGDPLIFETMIFCGKHDMDMQRYSRYDDALIGHDRMVEKVQDNE